MFFLRHFLCPTNNRPYSASFAQFFLLNVIKLVGIIGIIKARPNNRSPPFLPEILHLRNFTFIPAGFSRFGLCVCVATVDVWLRVTRYWLILFHFFWCCCYRCTSKNLAVIRRAAGSTELFTSLTFILSWARVRAIIQYYPNASPFTVSQLTFLQQ